MIRELARHAGHGDILREQILAIGSDVVANLSQLDRQHLDSWAQAAWQAWDTHHSTVLSWMDRWRQPHRPSRTGVRKPGVRPSMGCRDLPH